MKFIKSRKRKLIIMVAATVILSTSFVCYRYFHHNNISFYASFKSKVDLNGDEKKETVDFVNGKLTIKSSKGEALLNNEEKENCSSKIALLKGKSSQDTKIVLENKSKDTSGTLDFSIYKMEGNEIKEIAHKEDIYKGLLTVKDNGDVILDEPVYSKIDCNASPSKISKSYFSIKDNKLILKNTETVNSINYAADALTTYYKNPSYAEINKILEEVAYENNIPAEVFKAIAWQESKQADPDNGYVTNWRQFYKGQPLMSYDGVGVGVMQVSFDNTKPQSYNDRLKYDIEFNIREGARILLEKWNLQNSSITYKTPKVGDSSPVYLEHWYYAIWAYNGYSNINNPANNHDKAYETLVINHVNNVFNKSMMDLFVYNPNLFTANTLPRTDIEEINGRHSGDFRVKDINLTCRVTTNGLNIRDGNMNFLGTYNLNDIVVIKGAPLIKGSYTRYYVEGMGKSGYVISDYLRPVGDTNFDRDVDLYDFVKESKNIIGSGTPIDDSNRIDEEKFDIDGNNIIDIRDIALTAKNYNNQLYNNLIQSN